MSPAGQPRAGDPVNWYLDDFPPLAYTGAQPGMQDYVDDLQPVEGHLRLRLRAGRKRRATPWRCTRRSSARPTTSCASSAWSSTSPVKDGVWFATCEEIAHAWVTDEEDKRRLELEDVRGVEAAPVGSGFR